MDVYRRDYESKGDGRKQLIARIDELTSRQKKARELLLNGDLDGIEYRKIKSECESKINALEAKISDLSVSTPRIDDDLNRAISALSSINGLISLDGNKLNRELVGSIFPEKFTFQFTFLVDQFDHPRNV